MHITHIVPQYTQLNTIIAKVSHRQSIEFVQQQFVADFYNQSNDIQAFEEMLIDLTMQADTESSQILIQSLQTEIQNNIRLISSNKTVLDNLNIEKTCDKFANKYETSISNQLHITQELWKELSEVNNLLDAIGFREHSEQEEKRLWDKHETLSEKYNSEKDNFSPSSSFFSSRLISSDIPLIHSNFSPSYVAILFDCSISSSLSSMIDFVFLVISIL